jgi:hypothetical protein
LETEDAAEEERKVHSGRVEALEACVRRLEVKIRNTQDLRMSSLDIIIYILKCLEPDSWSVSPPGGSISVRQVWDLNRTPLERSPAASGQSEGGLGRAEPPAADFDESGPPPWKNIELFQGGPWNAGEGSHYLLMALSKSITTELIA